MANGQLIARDRVKLDLPEDLTVVGSGSAIKKKIRKRYYLSKKDCRFPLLFIKEKSIHYNIRTNDINRNTMFILNDKFRSN